jgi:IclR family acetate operon transcriptional repressor
MSKTFMRGLALLETIDLHGPLTVTELARHSGVDKSIVSRTITACEIDGWVVRSAGKVALGPRAALLGRSSAAEAAVRHAEPLVQALAGVTGLLTQAYALVGARAVLIASAGASIPVGIGTGLPLFATAAGKVIAAQLTDSELDRRLPPEPFPDAVAEVASLAGFEPLSNTLLAPSKESPSAPSKAARDRRQLAKQLEIVRRDGLATDAGEIDPALGCIAVPWPGQPSMPAALACMGSPASLATGEVLVKTVLAAAAGPAATREEIVASAASVFGAPPGP